MEIKTDAMIEQWDADADFYLCLMITAPSEEERAALFEAMKNRDHLKIVLEI